jgi:hypothetical protein
MALPVDSVTQKCYGWIETSGRTMSQLDEGSSKSATQLCKNVVSCSGRTSGSM